ncbi:SCO0607 family lipoprotein [Streptomyces sp. NPDC048330]|uniref:SCO0607 family lipoprotein n=1 Tax=Streptomyces sp. NPDC048330 TaxID=3365533 RepID=UPI00371DC272
MYATRRADRTVTASRHRKTRIAAALAGAAAVMALSGCAGVEYREDICSGGEYPVLSVGGTGSACVRDGEEPPAGFVRYPQGKVPEQVGDEWDLYWDTHTVDKDGKIVDAPDVS